MHIRLLISWNFSRLFRYWFRNVFILLFFMNSVMLRSVLSYYCKGFISSYCPTVDASIDFLFLFVTFCKNVRKKSPPRHLLCAFFCIIYYCSGSYSLFSNLHLCSWIWGNDWKSVVWSTSGRDKIFVNCSWWWHFMTKSTSVESLKPFMLWLDVQNILRKITKASSMDYTHRKAAQRSTVCNVLK